MLRYTKFGRHTYVVGSNDEAARRAGINVNSHLLKLYALSGMLAGLAGMMSLIRFSHHHDRRPRRRRTERDHRGDPRWHQPLRRRRHDPRHRRSACSSRPCCRTASTSKACSRSGSRWPPAFILIFAVYIDQLKRSRATEPDRLRTADHRTGTAHRPNGTPRLAFQKYRYLSDQAPNATARNVMRAATNWTVLCAAVASTALLRRAAAAVATRAPARGPPPRHGHRRPTERRCAGGGLVAPDGKLGKIVYVPGLTGNPFYNTVSCGAGPRPRPARRRLRVPGLADVRRAEADRDRQASSPTKPGAILISVTDPEAMDAPLKAAKDKGIKIITIDGDLADTVVMRPTSSPTVWPAASSPASPLAKAVGASGTRAADQQLDGFVREAAHDGFAAGVKSVVPEHSTYCRQYSNNDPAKAATFVHHGRGQPDSGRRVRCRDQQHPGCADRSARGRQDGQDQDHRLRHSDPIVTALKAGQLSASSCSTRAVRASRVSTPRRRMQGKSVPRNQAADSVFVTPGNVNTDKASSTSTT